MADIVFVLVICGLFLVITRWLALDEDNHDSPHFR